MQFSSPALMPTTIPTGRTKVLLAESDARERARLARFLEESGYDVHTVAGSSEALSMLSLRPFAALVLEQTTVGNSSADTVARALTLDPQLAVLVTSRVNDAPAAAAALGRGAFDYVQRPAPDAEVACALDRALKRRADEIERRRMESTVRETVILRTVQIEKEKAALRTLSLEIVQTLVRVMEAKDPYLSGHSERVAALSARVARSINMPFSAVEAVRLAGRVHDVGMIGIPESIVTKPGPLTGAEYDIMKTHVDLAVRILAPIHFIGESLTYVQDHHEYFDGSGYPRGLRGDEISAGGRIIAVCDAYDALTSARTFREAYTPARALEIVEGQAGRKFDPEICGVLRSLNLAAPDLTLL